MIEISNVRMPLDAGLPGAAGKQAMCAATACALGVSADALGEVRLLKRSVDARKKNDVHFVATLAVSLAASAKCDSGDAFQAADAEAAFVGGSGAAGSGGGTGVASGVNPVGGTCSFRLARGVNARRFAPAASLEIPDCSQAAMAPEFVRPVVVGAGPAGLFCALYLAEAGLHPLLVERGGNVDERTRAVEAFSQGGELDENTNIQFGEGGAGAFSDGKLTTGTKSSHIRHVLQAFADAGAPAEILWQAKPHIGTDYLPGVVRNLRERIVRAGGQVLFHTQLVGLLMEEGKLVEVELRTSGDASSVGDAGLVGGDNAASTMCDWSVQGIAGLQGDAGDECAKTYRIPARQVVLACGHSARDTFEMLRDAGLCMERKPFSVGVRIEHAQEFINHAQYGAFASHPALAAADYKLACHLPDGRGVYTFCMCPGGTVVAAASEKGGVCVNGMSRFARDGKNANSALLVEVRPDDLEGEDVLAGVALQRRMEQAAYLSALRAGGVPYSAPAQTVGGFLARAPLCAPSDKVLPTYSRGVAWCDLRECLPAFVADALKQALPLLDRKLHGFADPEAVMTAVEARSSSPVRIVRGANFQAQVRDGIASGVYPAGEGAGYAGGIMSAAVDGLRVAVALAKDAAVGLCK